LQIDKRGTNSNWPGKRATANLIDTDHKPHTMGCGLLKLYLKAWERL
jgi:hypothetical protein